MPDGGWVIGGAKTERRNSYRGFGISSTVICPSIRLVCETVEQ